MIGGVFGPDNDPYIVAYIKVPRLKAEGTFLLLMDTGADVTSLHLRDAVDAIGRKEFRLLDSPVSFGGVGGAAEYYEEPAEIVFSHDDGTEEGFFFDLSIAKPARRGSRKRQRQFELPSLLGMDILSQFRVEMDRARGRLFLDHS